MRKIADAGYEDATFVLVRLAPTDPSGIEIARAFAERSCITVRTCLAIDSFTLHQVVSPLRLNNRVSLMLDDVDPDTPLSIIAKEPIEAIRFRADFVARASRNVRLGCVLESMLLLAHNLGLCTMGPSAPMSEESIAPEPRFDYVPSPLVPIPVGPPPAPRLAFAAGIAVADKRLSR